MRYSTGPGELCPLGDAVTDSVTRTLLWGAGAVVGGLLS